MKRLFRMLLVVCIVISIMGVLNVFLMNCFLLMDFSLTNFLIFLFGCMILFWMVLFPLITLLSALRKPTDYYGPLVALGVLWPACMLVGIPASLLEDALGGIVILLMIVLFFAAWMFFYYVAVDWIEEKRGNKKTEEGE